MTIPELPPSPQFLSNFWLKLWHSFRGTHPTDTDGFTAFSAGLVAAVREMRDLRNAPFRNRSVVGVVRWEGFQGPQHWPGDNGNA
jgi:hypothetical protein